MNEAAGLSALRYIIFEIKISPSISNLMKKTFVRTNNTIIINSNVTRSVLSIIFLLVHVTLINYCTVTIGYYNFKENSKDTRFVSLCSIVAEMYVTTLKVFSFTL